jgi:hypothetical protein
MIAAWSDGSDASIRWGFDVRRIDKKAAPPPPPDKPESRCAVIIRRQRTSTIDKDGTYEPQLDKWMVLIVI